MAKPKPVKVKVRGLRDVKGRIVNVTSARTFKSAASLRAKYRKVRGTDVWERKRPTRKVTEMASRAVDVATGQPFRPRRAKGLQRIFLKASGGSPDPNQRGRFTDWEANAIVHAFPQDVDRIRTTFATLVRRYWPGAFTIGESAVEDSNRLKAGVEDSTVEINGADNSNASEALRDALQTALTQLETDDVEEFVDYFAEELTPGERFHHSKVQPRDGKGRFVKRGG